VPVFRPVRRRYRKDGKISPDLLSGMNRDFRAAKYGKITGARSPFIVGKIPECRLRAPF
jgi:hypothetical protein